MPHSYHRLDGIHAEAVKRLHEMGAATLSLAMKGRGVPDVLVWFRDVWLFVEFKEPGEGLTKAQAEFIARWPGRVAVVHSADEACLEVAEAARP